MSALLGGYLILDPEATTARIGSPRWNLSENRPAGGTPTLLRRFSDRLLSDFVGTIAPVVDDHVGACEAASRTRRRKSVTRRLTTFN